MSSTSGSDVVVAAWRTLDPDERELPYKRISDLRTIDIAGDKSASARMIRSLRLVTELTGPNPSVDQYRAARAELDVLPGRVDRSGRWDWVG